MRDMQRYASSADRGHSPVELGSGHLYPRSPSELLEPTRAPQPPRGRKRERRASPALGSAMRFLSGLFTIALMLMVALGAAYWTVRYFFDQPGPLEHATVIVIPKGDGVNAIAQRLEHDGVITDARVFTAAVLWFRSGGKLKAGEYEVAKNASMRQVLDTLVEGKAVLYSVSVPEGLTSYQVVQVLRRNPNLVGEITSIPAEGTLLPDTYKFSRNTERSELIARMQNEQEKYLMQQWEGRAKDLPFEKPEEALILASIVEKETGRAEERDRIAGVFVNRLRKRMRLQSDPTIIYGITQGKGALGRPIKRSEIDGKTDFNTYQIDGLPPTPISNPGRAAIEAVLAPAITKDLYFVADGTGGHAFAESIRDHQKNVDKWRVIYREIRAKQKAAAAAAAAAAASAGTAGQAAAPDEDVSAGPGVALDETQGGEEAGVTTQTTVGANGAATITVTSAQAAAVPEVAPAGGGIPVPARKPAKAN